MGTSTERSRPFCLIFAFYSRHICNNLFNKWNLYSHMSGVLNFNNFLRVLVFYCDDFKDYSIIQKRENVVVFTRKHRAIVSLFFLSVICTLISIFKSKYAFKDTHSAGYLNINFLIFEINVMMVGPLQLFGQE